MKVTHLLRSDVHTGIFFFAIPTMSFYIKKPERSPLNALQLFFWGGEILGYFLHLMVLSQRPQGHPTSAAHQLNPLSLP